MYALEDIPARRKVIEYTGEKISRRETKRRSEEGGRMIYLFTLNDYWTVDGSVGGSGAEYINHCCDPNITTVIRSGHILYMSRKPIRIGDELTVDYHFASDIEKYVCKCGAATCRGTINLK
jgi:SET domain-containing protein